MDLHLRDRVVLITGGGTGIGLEAAKRFALEGAAVAISGRRPEFVQEAAEEITVDGGRAIAVVGDVAKLDDAQRMVSEAVAAFGRLDILVNNAGVFRGGPMASMPIEHIDLLIDINLRGVLYLTRAAIPELAKTRGCIISVTSVLSLQGSRKFPSAAYAATKGAVESLTRSLAVELAADGIRVNAISPAVVETPIYETFMPKESVPKALEAMENFHPLGRNGRPEEIAEAMLFLASPVSSWTTGAILHVDGGRSAE